VWRRRRKFIEVLPICTKVERSYESAAVLGGMGIPGGPWSSEIAEREFSEFDLLMGGSEGEPSKVTKSSSLNSLRRSISRSRRNLTSRPL